MVTEMNQMLHHNGWFDEEPEPTWEIAYLFPAQGQWSEEEYLALDTNHLIELSNGFLEFLPMPTMPNQLLVAYLYGLLLAFVSPNDLGTPLFAGLPIRLSRRKFREPDMVFMLKEHSDRMGLEYWDRADLVMEVVSGSAKDRYRDLKKKRAEYARAGIPEYWIVDPKEEMITVLKLSRRKYVVHGEFIRGTKAASHLLPGFTVDVTAAFTRSSRPGIPDQPRRIRRRR
jgi:Uma2 family endonuclease